ncbi:MAG: DUF4190 domain-containing protein [Acidimicrobiales bacterium]
MSLVLSVAWIYWFGSILAIVLGYAARWQLRERREQGRFLAATAIVIGWIGIGVLVVILGAIFVHDRGRT